MIGAIMKHAKPKRIEIPRGRDDIGLPMTKMSEQIGNHRYRPDQRRKRNHVGMIFASFDHRKRS
jgi:hypothetical protein